jgi:hypothetical protein
MSTDPLAMLISVKLLSYLLGGAIFGIAAAMIRERSHSILTAWLFHAIAAATSLLSFGPL